MRSKKLSRLIFYVVAVGASATLRLNPQLVNEIANYFAEPSQATQVATHKNAPIAVIRNTMPKDRIKVRRGITRQAQLNTADSQTMSKETEKMLREIEAGQ